MPGPDTEVSDMPLASALVGNEYLYCVQGGDTKCTPSQISDYVYGVLESEGLMEQPTGSSYLATSQASIGTSASLLVAARTGAPGTGRIAATLYNVGSATIYFGPSGVTTATGFPINSGGVATVNTQAAIYGISTSGTQTICVMETF